MLALVLAIYPKPARARLQRLAAWVGLATVIALAARVAVYLDEFLAHRGEPLPDGRGSVPLRERSLVLVRRIDESLHDRILEIRVH
jgi:hypothetical protein